MSQGGSSKHQWVGWAILVLSITAVTGRYVFVQGADPTLSVAMAAAGLVGVIIAVVAGRHEFKVDGANELGPLSMRAGLVFSAMPNDWQRLVLDAADPKARKRGGFTVTVRATDDSLVIERVWDPLLYFEPFEARFPMAAVNDVVVGPPVMGHIGATLTFHMASGGTVRFDVQAGTAMAERVAQRFRDVAISARSGGPAPPATLRLVSERISMDQRASEARAHQITVSRYYKIAGSIILAVLLFVAGFAVGSIGRQSANHRAAKAEVALTSSNTRANDLQTQLDQANAMLEVVQADTARSFGDGTYKVGRDIHAGLYHNPGMPKCYWAKLKSSNQNDTIDNGGSGGPEVVTIDSPYFTSKGCGTWDLVG